MAEGDPKLSARNARAPAREGSKPKLAVDIAASIERQIAAAGWRISAVLGSEGDLLRVHRVSRSVLREAVRILEHRGVARMRPGPGGGLVVTAPDGQAVTSAIESYLDYQAATTSQLFEVRRALELPAVEQVVERLDEAAIARLRTRIATEASIREQYEHGASSPNLLDAAMSGDEFHTIVAELAGNPATEVLVRALSQATWSRYQRQHHERHVPLAPSERVHDHALIVEAIVAGDGALARHRMHKHLDELETLIQANSHESEARPTSAASAEAS